MKKELKAYKKDGIVVLQEKEGTKLFHLPKYCQSKRAVIAWIKDRNLDSIYSLDNIEFAWVSYSKNVENCKTIGEINKIAVISKSLDTGEEKRFDSIKAASLFFGISSSSIGRSLRGSKSRSHIEFRIEK